MDCSECGEPVRAATIFCENCGKRLEHPAYGSGRVATFDRRQWSPLPAAPNHVEYDVIGFVVEALLELPGFLDLL